MSDTEEKEPIQSSKFTFSKNESKIFTTIVKYGPQTKNEIILASAMEADKVEETLDLLLTKGLVELDNDIFYPSLPVNNILALLESSFNEINSNRENQQEISQQHLKIIQENLDNFNKSLEGKFNDLKTSSNLLQASLKDDLEAVEQNRVTKTNEIADELLETFNMKVSSLQTETTNSLAAKQTSFDKAWENFIDDFNVIPDSGTRSLKEPISRFDKELSTIVGTTTDKIKSIQSRFLDIFKTIETESISQIQGFFTTVDSASSELKSNIETGLHESRKNEREFVSEVRQYVHATLEDEITKALQNVVSALSKEIDTGINEALKYVKQQTDSAINTSSNQLKTEFGEFAESASELIQAQRSSLDVLSTELSEISVEHKLSTQKGLLLKQLQSQLSAELTSVEGNYRRVQKKINEIMENIRKSAKDRLIQQSSEFEKLVHTFNEVNEKSIDRKDMDITRLQQISQSVSHFLQNLLISIPGSANTYKSSLRDALKSTKNELEKSMNETSEEAIKDINTVLGNSQKRVDSLFKETKEENIREIQSVINSVEQLNNTISNLQQTYVEKIENRFDLRSKVMNTELETVSRNFQQVLNGIQSGFGSINERLSSENVARTTDIETSIHNSTSSLENDLDTLFTQNQNQNIHFSEELEKNLEDHLDRTLEVIKEGFSQIKSEFGLEVKKQLKEIHMKNEKQENDIISVIAKFSDETSIKLNEFKNNFTTSINENEKTINDFIGENQLVTAEVINLHKSNINKYQEKGPSDILNFIKQIETEVSTQNKNLKESMEELASYYSGYSDSSLNEVSNLIRQVQESGEKLSTIANSSLQIVTNNLSRTSDNIDIYFSNSLTDLENQIGVVTGFVTSEVDTATEIVKEETETLKLEMKQTVKDLNTEIKDFVTRQDQEFQTKIPELSKEFEMVFDDLIKEKSQSDQEFEKNVENHLEKLKTNWNKEMQKAISALKDLSSALNNAIGSNIENFEVIVNTNVEETIKRINSIFSLDSKEDIFGLREIQSTVKQANKRLKSAISESLQSQLEEFDKKLPEIVTSYEAIHSQTEEDLSTYIEELRDLILSSQTSLSSQIHDYVKDEKDQLDFSEIKDDLKEIQKNFSQSTTQEIESLSSELANSIKNSIDQTDKSREEILTLFTDIPTNISERDNNLIIDLAAFKDKTLESFEKISNDSRKELANFINDYNNDLEKGTFGVTGKSTQLVQTLSDEIGTQFSEMLEGSNRLLDNLKAANTRHKESLQELAKELSSTKPDRPVRIISLATNDARNEYIKEIVNLAKKQVIIFTSNPTFLSPADLQSIPSEKRIWIYSSYDFTKKGKKWLSEVGDQVNINLRKAKTRKISGIIVVQDDESALVLPDTLGYTTTDPKFISHLSEFLNLLKGASLRKKSG
ncbi:MAG: helix-turn-helix domain-containing protein [Candidatus Hodarchaeales archaeon]|jgi:sugar-specific transcriptional regulator TrmB